MSDNPMSDITNLKEFRESKKLTQKQLAIKCGVSQPTISLIEKNGLNNTKKLTISKDTIVHMINVLREMGFPNVCNFNETIHTFLNDYDKKEVEQITRLNVQEKAMSFRSIIEKKAFIRKILNQNGIDLKVCVNKFGDTHFYFGFKGIKILDFEEKAGFFFKTT